MKAYYRAQDLNGIKWTVERVIAQNLLPSTPILKHLHAMQEQYQLVNDAEQEKIVMALIFQLGVHRASLETESRKRAEFLVDFIKGAVGIRRKRRFGTNWPLLLKKGKQSVDRKWDEPTEINSSEYEPRGEGSIIVPFVQEQVKQGDWSKDP